MANNDKPNTTDVRRGSRLPLPLYKAIEQVTKPVFKTRGLAEARLITEWHLIAGSVLSEKSLPQKIVFQKGKRGEGVLHLVVAPGWALEVQHLEPVILDKIATYFGYRAVAKIHILQAPLPKTAEEKKPAPLKPLDAKTRAQLNIATESVENSELKESLTALGEAILRRNSHLE